MDPKERHRLGAHFTPRSYVERLVNATIELPLRSDWDLVRAEVRQLVEAGKSNDAIKAVETFHERLLATKVLDPACGTGNFLYVSLDLFKRLEAEVLTELHSLGKTGRLELEGVTISPAQFLGIEVKPWAREIADLVLWIGYLQWHYRTHPEADWPEPVLREYKNINCCDALILWERVEPLHDASGAPITRWDGETYKPSAVTGEPVPDESARVPVVKYVGAQPIEWPAAEFVVGNPPFLGKLEMLRIHGDGYVDAVRTACEDLAPDGVDFVMYWWAKASRLVLERKLRRFGLITTKAITQSFSRRVVADFLDKGGHIAFAIPNHPWVDSSDGAQVRIAMTVGDSSSAKAGVLQMVLTEDPQPDGSAALTLKQQTGLIMEDLRVGADIVSAEPLQANAGIAAMGFLLGSRGFTLDRQEAEELLALGPAYKELIHPLRNGRDITDRPRDMFAIDAHGLGLDELAERVPRILQRLRDKVLPERRTNRDPRLQRLWWLYRRTNEQLRSALTGLPRYIVTSETAKHRVFVFLDAHIKPEHKLVVIASSDAFVLGVLSSRVHGAWALAAGGRLGVGDDPVYVKSASFEKFPFPIFADNASEEKERIRSLGERIDAHRKKQLDAHARLTITDMYNALVKVRGGQPLTERDKEVYEEALVGVLAQLHEDLDAAVLRAYGWAADLTDEQILEKLVALNAERRAAELRGDVHWLSPDKRRSVTTQIEVAEDEQVAAEDGAAPSSALPAWPSGVPAQLAAVKALFIDDSVSLRVEDVCGRFKKARKATVEQHLESLASLGLLVCYRVEGTAYWHR